MAREKDSRKGNQLGWGKCQTASAEEKEGCGKPADGGKRSERHREEGTGRISLPSDRSLSSKAPGRGVDKLAQLGKALENRLGQSRLRDRGKRPRGKGR